MADITFARTRHHYDQYDDFYRLAELSGFPIIYLDEIDFSEPGVYITSPKNGEWAHFENEVAAHKPRNAHIVWWCLERPANAGGGGGALYTYARDNRQAMYDRLCDEVWVSDPALADETGLRYVVLGSHPDVGETSDAKRYDWTHQSYDGPGRRQRVYYHKDLKPYVIGPNAWNPERHEILKASRFGVAVHQDSHPFQEPLRNALFASYGLPILMETCKQSWPWSGETSVMASLDEIPAKLIEMLKSDYAQWRQMGQWGRELMCYELEFGKMVRRAVKESTGEDWR